MDEEEKILKFKLRKCKKCGASTDIKDNEEKYCSNCGSPVLNICSNYQCGEILKEDAKYCKICGASSTFKNYGFFNESSPDDELPF